MKVDSPFIIISNNWIKISFYVCTKFSLLLLINTEFIHNAFKYAGNFRNILILLYRILTSKKVYNNGTYWTMKFTFVNETYIKYCITILKLLRTDTWRLPKLVICSNGEIAARQLRSDLSEQKWNVATKTLQVRCKSKLQRCSYISPNGQLSGT